MLSLKKRFAGLGKTIQNYPIAVTMLCVMAVCSLYLIWVNTYSRGTVVEFRLVKILLIAGVAVCLSATVTKRYRKDEGRHMLWQGLIVLGSIVYFVLFPADMNDATQSFIVRHFLLQFIALGSLLVVPLWIQKRPDTSIYKGVVHLALHVSIAGVFTGILIAGILGALGGIEALFEISIVSEWYATLATLIGILFGGISFLDGLRIWETHEKEDIVTHKRNVLLGRVVGLLLVLYGLILYTYLAKIIVTGNRPSNEVTPLSFAFSGFVIVTAVLVVPVITHKKSVVSRNQLLNWMFLSLVPIIGMIVIAITQRVMQYGMTEMRYLVCLIVLWLLVSTVYMVFSQKKDLWFIACGVLGFATVAVLGGPISARGVGQHCQTARIEAVMERNKTVVGAQLTRDNVSDLSKKDKIILASAVDYLVDYYGVSSIQGLMKGSPQTGWEAIDELGLSSIRNEVQSPEFSRQYLSTVGQPNSQKIDIAAYSTIYSQISLYARKGSSASFSFDDATVTMTKEGAVSVAIEGRDEFTFDAAKLLKTYTNKIPEPYVDAESGTSVLIRYMHGYQNDGVVTVESLTFDLLLQ